MTERIILGVKRGAKAQPSLGLISAIAEEIDGKLYPITKENFCSTKEVFIVNSYDEIQEKFRDNELFKIRVELNQTQNGPCQYKSSGRNAEKLQPNDVAEIVYTDDLPDRNLRILNVDSLPITKYILIQNNAGDCYGPFYWEEDQSRSQDGAAIELKIITSGGLGNKSGGEKKRICKLSGEKINSSAVDCEYLSVRKKLVKNVSTVISGATFEEYANDKEIIEEIKKMAGESVGRTIDKKDIELLISFARKNKEADYSLNKSRIALFNKIATSNADILNEINDLIDGYLKSLSGIKFIEDYVQKNKEKYIDKLKSDKKIELDDEIKNRRNECDQIRKDIEKFHQEKTRLSDEVEAKRKYLEKDIVANQKAYIEKISKESQEKIAEINEKEATAQKRLSDINVRIGKVSEFDDIKKLVIRQQGVLDHIQQQIEEKKKDRDAVLEESRRAEDDIRKKLRVMKPYVDHLNGSFAGEEFKHVDIKINCSAFSYKEEISAQRTIINSVKTRLAKLGRLMDDQEIANLLISTQQSFITLFAGLPGVGKTSLCKLMAQAEGIENRLHSVSVARGWTSIKDMVGFHNPLNDKFQPASTGLYEFLTAINDEAAEGRSNSNSYPMSYILLDEANLSSIEHYWSAFMGMTDATTNQNLPIGGQKSLIIPRSLRFLATINYDGTTEPLSPRVLDRAAVIVMRPGEISFHHSDMDEEILQSLPISSEQMDALFGLFNDAPELEADEKSALEAISDVLSHSSGDKGRSIHISQRKINAIRQYCGRARPLMRSDGDVIALDWAIMQHVLPRVTGHGSKFGNRLIALKKCFEDHDLEKSAGYLDQMISSGQNDLHSYEFFCW